MRLQLLFNFVFENLLLIHVTTDERVFFHNIDKFFAPDNFRTVIAILSSLVTPVLCNCFFWHLFNEPLITLITYFTLQANGAKKFSTHHSMIDNFQLPWQHSMSEFVLIYFKITSVLLNNFCLKNISSQIVAAITQSLDKIW